MRKTLATFMAFISLSSFGLQCSGGGYTVTVSNDDTMSISGNGVEVSGVSANFMGSSYSATVNDQGVRNVTLSPDIGTFRLVKDRGQETVDVTCQ